MGVNRRAVSMINHIIKSVSQVLNDFFTTDMDVISKDCKKTLDNPVSRVNYARCIQEMRQHDLTENTFIDYDGEAKTIKIL